MSTERGNTLGEDCPLHFNFLSASQNVLFEVLYQLRRRTFFSGKNGKTYLIQKEVTAL
jgi:hypothetical protein